MNNDDDDDDDLGFFCLHWLRGKISAPDVAAALTSGNTNCDETRSLSRLQ